MSNKERGVPSNPEIGPKESNAFEQKVRDLIKNPIGLSDVYLPYQKGEKMSVVIQYPGTESQQTYFGPFASIVSAYVSEHIFTNEKGNSFFRQKGIEQDYFSGEMEYEEKTIEVDSNGSLVRSPISERVSDLLWEEKIDALRERADYEKALGTGVATRENYEEIMAVLNTLTPEDEIKK